MGDAGEISRWNRLKRYYQKNGCLKTFLHSIKKVKKAFFDRFIPSWSFIERPLVHIRIFFRRFVRYTGLPLESRAMRRMAALKDRHAGERCFVVCTGPSLTMSDIEKLSGEITFGMNTITLLYADTKWRPTYYTVVDNYSQGDILRRQELPDGRYSQREAFFSSLIKPRYHADDIHFCLVHCRNHSRRNMDRNLVEVSDDPSVCIFDCFTVTNMAIQLALYMGFQEIYLIGADCNYSQEKMHFIETDFDRETRGAAWYSEAVRLNQVGYQAVDRFARARGCRIYNATRGGMLEVFPRVNLDELLSGRTE